jgi:hypothetical protein
MKFYLRIVIDDQLLRELQQYFKVDTKIVRQDLMTAMVRTVQIYERDVARVTRGKMSKRGDEK